MTTNTNNLNQFFEDFTQTFNNKKDLEYQAAIFNNKMDSYIRNHHDNLKKALYYNKRDIIEKEVLWGMPPINDVNRFFGVDFDHNSEVMEFLFGNNNNLSDEYRVFFFEKMEKCLLNNLTKEDGKISANFADQLQWILQHEPLKFIKKYQEVVFKKWGAIPFSLEKHELLNQYIVNNHPNLAQTFINASTLNLKSFPSYSIEDLYQISDYQNALNQKLKNEQLHQELAKEGFAQAISNNSVAGINFWLSFHTSFPENPSIYAKLIGSKNYNKDFNTCFNILLDNHMLAVGKHVMLRTAINIKNDTLIHQLLSSYSLKLLEEAKPLLRKNTEYLSIWEKYFQHQYLEKVLPFKEDGKKYKI